MAGLHCLWASPDAAAGNVERLGTHIRLGTLDAMLVRPVPLFVQISRRSVRSAPRRTYLSSRAGVRLGGVVSRDRLDDGPGRDGALSSAAWHWATFLAIFTLGAAIQFWTSDSSEELPTRSRTVAASLAQYPLTIYLLDAVKALTFRRPTRVRQLVSELVHPRQT
ncbi:MAG: hypothetical protein WKF82_01100 [Nocardioidaceae bacterium]